MESNTHQTYGRLLLLGLVISYNLPLSANIHSISIYPFDLFLIPLTFLWGAKFKWRIKSRYVGFKILIIYFSFLIWVVISTGFSVNHVVSISEMLLFARLLIISIVIISAYGSWYTLVDVGWIAALIVVFQGTLSIIQALTQTSIGQLNQYFGTKEAITSYRNIYGLYLLRVSGTLGNPNILANWLIILLPISSFLKLNEVRGSRAFFIFMSVIGCASLLLTISRGSIAIFLLTLSVTLLLYLLLNFIETYISLIIYMVFLTALYSSILMILLFPDLDLMTARRIKIIESLGIIKAFPIFGTGIGAYQYGRDLLNLRLGFRSFRVHNILLLITAETGIIGGILFIYSLHTLLKIITEPLVFKVRDQNPSHYMSANINWKRVDQPTYHSNAQGIELGIVSLIYFLIYLQIILIMNLYLTMVSFQFAPLSTSVLATGVAVFTSNDV